MFTHRKYSCFTQLSKNSCHPHYEIYIYEVPDAHHWGYIANLSHLYLGCLNENSFNFKHINLPEGGRETCINDTYSTLLPTKNPWTWICYAQKPSNYHPSSPEHDVCFFSSSFGSSGPPPPATKHSIWKIWLENDPIQGICIGPTRLTRMPVENKGLCSNSHSPKHVSRHPGGDDAIACWVLGCRFDPESQQNLAKRRLPSVAFFPERSKKGTNSCNICNLIIFHEKKQQLRRSKKLRGRWCTGCAAGMISPNLITTHLAVRKVDELAGNRLFRIGHTSTLASY